MRIQLLRYKDGTWQIINSGAVESSRVCLVLVFAAPEFAASENLYAKVKNRYSNSDIVICSTAGEICGLEVTDQSVVIVAIEFSTTMVKTFCREITSPDRSRIIGQQLAGLVHTKDLVHILVFAEGNNINGSELVSGITNVLPSQIKVTGGLAGDGNDFNHTYLGLNNPGRENQIIVVGLYGEDLITSSGSKGGWDIFGIERTVTKAENNIVYEIDHEPILDLYKRYLGDKADGLPATGLLFPISIKGEGNQPQIVRTLLSIDEKAKSITFAGNIPEGSVINLMKANRDNLVSGAEEAATQVNPLESPDFALLISCIGRKSVLQDRVEEELEAVRNVLGDSCLLAGFYSYGELAPTDTAESTCELHNQTMTITAFKER